MIVLRPWHISVNVQDVVDCYTKHDKYNGEKDQQAKTQVDDEVIV